MTIPTIDVSKIADVPIVLKNIFIISPFWLYPEKVYCSSDDLINEKDFNDFIDEVFYYSYSLQNKSAEGIIPFLRLEMEGIQSLMHYLVIFKHSINIEYYIQLSSSIKCIEEKCKSELTLEEHERYFNVKNGDGLTYKELDQRLQDKKIKDIFFRTLKEQLTLINKLQKSSNVEWLMDSLCTESLETSKYLKNVIITNLKLLLKNEENNENFFHQFVRRCWESNATPVVIQNYFLLLNLLRSCGANRRLREDAGLALTATNQQGLTMEALHNGLASWSSIWNTGIFLKNFFACPEAFEDSDLFGFRLRSICRMNYQSTEIPLCEGDSLLHIAIRLLHANLIDTQMIERIIDRAIFFPIHGGTFLRACNLEKKQYKNLLTSDEKIQFDNFLMNSIIKLFNKLYLEDFSKFCWSLTFLESIKLVNSGLISLKRVGDYFFYLVDQVYGLAGSQLAKSNLSQWIQLLKNEKRRDYASACKKLLEYRNSGGVSLLDYTEIWQLHSQVSNQLPEPAKIPLSAWESMLITSCTEEARELLANSEEREIIIANLMKKALETRKQKISHEPNSLGEAKFIIKLNNSIKKLL